MIHFKVMLRTNTENNKGEHPVQIRLTQVKNVKYLPLKITVHPKYWNDKVCLVRDTHPNADEYNDLIKSKLERTTKVLARIEQFRTLNIETYTENDLDLFFKWFNVPDSLMTEIIKTEKAYQFDQTNVLPDTVNISVNGDKFQEAWDKFMEFNRKEKRNNTVRRYPFLLEIITEYCKLKKIPLAFKSFDKQFMFDLKDYLLNDYVNYRNNTKGICDNTIYSYKKNISAFLNWSYEHKYNTYNEFKQWKSIKAPETDLQYLKKNQLNELFNFETKLETSKYLWCLMAFTGMRFGDLIRFHKSWVDGDFIEYISEKTNKKCTVPILPETRKILMHFNFAIPKINNVQLNEDIKTILYKMGYDQTIQRNISINNKFKALDMKFFNMITVHSSRRTFINLCVSNNVNIMHLSTMVGDDVKSLMIYYKADKDALKQTMLKII